MKKIITFLFLTSYSFAQNQNNIWCFGDSAGIDFNTSSPASFNSIVRARGSCTSVADSSGSLLFYAFTNATFNYSTIVANNLHQIMQNGDTIVGESWANELTILPKPNSNNLFYLFSMSETNVPTEGLWVSTIDMNANVGLGSVIQKNKCLNNFRNADCVTAIKHGNGRDWWVFSKHSNTNATQFNRTYTYLVTPDTIMPPIIQNFNNCTDADVQRIIFRPDGNKMMQINVGGFMCEYDFDRCTGLFSNPVLIFPEQTSNFSRLFWSGTYSPDGNKFYATTQYYFNVDTSYIIQYDLTAANIPLSADTLHNFVWPVQAGAVRLAPDNKLYMACFYDWGFPGFPYPDSVRNMYNENLSVVNYPDSLGAACDFQPFSFYLGGKRTYWGLPNNPDYNLGRSVGSPCDTLTSVAEILTDDLYFSISPNPSNGNFKINYQLPHNKTGALQILDITGKAVYKKDLPQEVKIQLINVENLSNGIYLCKITTDNFIATKKLIIQKE